MPKDGSTNGPAPKEGAHSGSIEHCPDEMTIAAYLDERMGARELTRMELHLSRCVKCAKSVQELREILAQVHSGQEDPDHVSEIAQRAKKLVGG